MTADATASPGQSIRAWFRDGFGPAPLSSGEWMMMRVAFAALLLVLAYDWHPFEFAGQPSPVGIARWVDLTWLHHDGVYEVMFGLTAVGCLAYVIGFALRLVLPLLTATQIVVFTYNNSQGFTSHGVQLVSMVLLTQTIVVWWKRHETPENLRAWLWFYSRGLILFSYCASALNKIIGSRGLWVWQSKYLPIEIVKTRRYDYYKSLDPALLGDPPSALWLVQHPVVAQIVFGAGFFLELFAFLGLRDRRWSAFIGLAIIAMHQSITWIMSLTFDNHQWLCLIFLVNLPGWLLLLWQKKHATSLSAIT